MMKIFTNALVAGLALLCLHANAIETKTPKAITATQSDTQLANFLIKAESTDLLDSNCIPFSALNSLHQLANKPAQEIATILTLTKQEDIIDDADDIVSLAMISAGMLDIINPVLQKHKINPQKAYFNMGSTDPNLVGTVHYHAKCTDKPVFRIEKNQIDINLANQMGATIMPKMEQKITEVVQALQSLQKQSLQQ